MDRGLWEGFPFCRDRMHQVYRTSETLLGGDWVIGNSLGMGSGSGERGSTAEDSVLICRLFSPRSDL